MSHCAVGVAAQRPEDCRHSAVGHPLGPPRIGPGDAAHADVVLTPAPRADDAVLIAVDAMNDGPAVQGLDYVVPSGAAWPQWLSVENPCLAADHYGMGSQRTSFDTESLRAAAAGSSVNAAELEDYRQACKQWIAEAEREVLRCHGPVAAPVAAALHDFFTDLQGQAAAVTDRHRAMENALQVAAAGYDDTDAAGATAVHAAGGVV